MASDGWDRASRHVDTAVAAFNARPEVAGPFEYADQSFQLEAAQDRVARSFLHDPEWAKELADRIEAAGVYVRTVPGGTLVNLAGAEFVEFGWSQFEVDGLIPPLCDERGRHLDGITVASHASGDGEQLSVWAGRNEWIPVSPAALIEVLERHDVMQGEPVPINLVGCRIAGPFAQEVAALTGRSVRASILNINMGRGIMTPRAAARDSEWVFDVSGSDSIDTWVVHEPKSEPRAPRSPDRATEVQPARGPIRRPPSAHSMGRGRD